MRAQTPLQIRFNDIDLAGHVHNGVYLSYFEQGRMDFFNTVLKIADWNWDEQSLILARNEINYEKPIFLNDAINVETFLIKYGHKSITLGYIIKRGAEICTQGLSILVCYDYSLKSTIEIPKAWKSRLEILSKSKSK